MESQTRLPPPPIILRRFTLSDTDDLMEWISDDRVSQNARWEICKTKEEALHYLTNTIIPHPWFKAICLKSTNTPVGFIYTTVFSGAERCRVKLGCSVAYKHWATGVGTATVKMAVGKLFAEYGGLERIEAHTAFENVGGRKLLEKSGFAQDGILKRYCVIKGRMRDMVATLFQVVKEARY